MSDLNEVLAFTKVVEFKSYSRAAEHLGVPKSNLSRKIASLEERLSIRLLQRTTRTLSLTEAGHIYYEECKKALDKIGDAESIVSSLQAIPQGLLRVTMSVEIGYFFVRYLLPKFLQQYPKIKLETILTNDRVDLIKDNVDLALRIGSSEDSTYIAKRFGVVRVGLFASKEYLEINGTPKSPQDLAKHNCILFSHRQLWNTWSLTNKSQIADVNVDGKYIANNFTAIREGVINGLGIGFMPELVFFEECQSEKGREEIIHILPEWNAPERDLSLVYPSRKFTTPKMKAFMDFIETHKNHFN
ncbi:MAG: LysR family transcriptional regulator [Bdellovibrionota bacterium]